MINKNSKIYISGHKGMVGSSILNYLKKKNYNSLIFRSKKQLNLLDQKKTFDFLMRNKPDVVIIAAARVGGVNINNIDRGQFIYENIQIQNNLIHGSYLSGVKKLIFLGSSCIYPKNSKQPIKEEYLLSGSLEQTNEPYAIAKIAGLKMIENYNRQYKTNYLCLMPCNLYGPNDNYDLLGSHFLPALIKKIHIAKLKKDSLIEIWGNGKPKRELMFVEDLSNAIEYFMSINVKEHLINIGSGYERSITYYANLICKIVGHKCKFQFNSNMPNGTYRKLLDCSIAKSYGWRPNYDIALGLKSTYTDFKKNYKNV